MRYEWDEAKEVANLQKHGVSFTEVLWLFESGADHLELFDAVHSENEDRFIAIGASRGGIVVVAWTGRGDDVTRIINARKATHRETELFRERMRYLE